MRLESIARYWKSIIHSLSELAGHLSGEPDLSASNLRYIALTLRQFAHQLDLLAIQLDEETKIYTLPRRPRVS